MGRAFVVGAGQERRKRSIEVKVDTRKPGYDRRLFARPSRSVRALGAVCAFLVFSTITILAVI